jgi:hypothetical protein
VLAAPGDWDGDKRADLMSVGADGRLWLYPGDGRGGVGAAKEIGNGWSGYRVIPAGDLTGDGIVDVLAVRDATGDLFLYAGRGGGAFKYPYPRVGYGWSGYQLHAAGDVNKDGAADVLGIDPAGDLYLYSGRGDGSFRAKTKVGNGWSGVTLAAGADLDGDKVADIVSRFEDTATVYFYKGTGSGKFAAKKQIATNW